MVQGELLSGEDLPITGVAQLAGSVGMGRPPLVPSHKGVVLGSSQEGLLIGMGDHGSSQSLSIVVHLLGSSRVDLGPVPLLTSLRIYVLLQVLSNVISRLVGSHTSSHNLVDVLSMLLRLTPDGLAECPAFPIELTSHQHRDYVLGNIAIGPLNGKASLLQPVSIILDHSSGSIHYALLYGLLKTHSQ